MPSLLVRASRSRGASRQGETIPCRDCGDRTDQGRVPRINVGEKSRHSCSQAGLAGRSVGDDCSACRRIESADFLQQPGHPREQGGLVDPGAVLPALPAGPSLVYAGMVGPTQASHGLFHYIGIWKDQTGGFAHLYDSNTGLYTWRPHDPFKVAGATCSMMPVVEIHSP